MTTGAEEFLRSFHDRYPGATSAAFGGLRVTSNGVVHASTYEALASSLPALSRGAAVLDLACGDGHLLSVLARRTSARLLGVDISRGEIGRASASHGGEASFLMARAQALPLRATSIDHVVCHMALMLMDDVHDVLAEVRRVLRPKGRFVAIVDAHGDGGPGLRVFLDAYARVSRLQRYAALRFGDRRLRTVEGIREVMEPHFDEVAIDRFEASRHATPAESWQWFMTMYDPHLLGDEERRTVERAFLDAASAACDADGRLEYRNAFYRIGARRT